MKNLAHIASAIAAALLALSGALALPAQAQTTTTFVSNTGEVPGNSTGDISAQSFTTGSNPGGYTLSDVALQFQLGRIGKTYVTVKRDASGAPGDLVANLSNPESFTTQSIVSFTAPASTTLAANRVYWVVVNEGIASIANRISVYPTSSNDQTVTTAYPRWSIADTRLRHNGTTWVSSSNVLMLAINGTELSDTVVIGTAITSSPDANSNYVTGEVIRVTVTFNLPVTVDRTSGTPRLALTVGSNTRLAYYSASGSTATSLVFAYPVLAEDHDGDGISIVANALELNGGAIHRPGDTSTNAVLDHRALSTQSAHRVNHDPFIVTDGVSVTSTPQAATDTYGAGETIEISVTFNEAVTATTATDFVLDVAGAKRAPLSSGSGTETLVFGYTVQAGDNDTNGIWIGDQDRTLVGNRRGEPQNGAITSAATGRAADLTHSAIRTLDGHKVDGSLMVPQVTIAADHSAFTAELDDVTFTLTRVGSTAAALTVGVALTQDQDLLLSEDLAQTVPFGAGEATATLQLTTEPFRGHPDGHGAGRVGLRAGLAECGKHADRGDRPGRHGVDRGDRLHVRRGRHRRGRRGRHHPAHRGRRAAAP